MLIDTPKHIQSNMNVPHTCYWHPPFHTILLACRHSAQHPQTAKWHFEISEHLHRGDPIQAWQWHTVFTNTYQTCSATLNQVPHQSTLLPDRPPTSVTGHPGNTPTFGRQYTPQIIMLPACPWHRSIAPLLIYPTLWDCALLCPIPPGHLLVHLFCAHFFGCRGRA